MHFPNEILNQDIIGQRPGAAAAADRNRMNAQQQFQQQQQPPIRAQGGVIVNPHRSNRNNGNRLVGWLREWSTPSKAASAESLYHYLSKKEYVWRLVFFASTCFGIFLIEKIYIFHTHEDYEKIAKTEFVDFVGSLFIVALILSARILIKHFLFERTKALILPQKLQKSNCYQQLICERIVSITFYIIMSLWGYFLMQEVESKWEITTYGDIFTAERYTNQLIPNTKLRLRHYYIVQVGYHLFFFLQAYIWNLEHQKYYEWLLHHGIAILLLFYSYMFNLLVVGLYVLFWHNVSDLGLVVARTYTILKCRKKFITYLLYLIEYVVWVYARNYVFPFQIIYSSVTHYRFVALDPIFAWPIFYLILLMLSLASMHLYWTYYITQALLYLVLGGKEYNSYDEKE